MSQDETKPIIVSAQAHIKLLYVALGPLAKVKGSEHLNNSAYSSASANYGSWGGQCRAGGNVD